MATTSKEGGGAGAPLVLGVFTRSGLAMTGLLSLAFLGLFWRWYVRQHRFSLANVDDWGHAYFIPAISLYMVWRARSEVGAALREGGAWWGGLIPLVMGMVCYVFFIVGVSNHMLQGASLILALFGLVLLVGGTSLARVVFLPIAFLGFGVTISEAWMIKLTFPLQLIASQGAGMVLTILGPLFGYSVEAIGNVLTIVESGGESHDLDVAEACSGLRMVVAFFALAAAVALLSTDRWWQRVALVVLAFPVAVLINVVRVAVLGLATLVDADLAAGSAHTLIGTLLLIPGLMLFMGVRWSLTRLVAEGA